MVNVRYCFWVMIEIGFLCSTKLRFSTSPQYDGVDNGLVQSWTRYAYKAGIRYYSLIIVVAEEVYITLSVTELQNKILLVYGCG